MTVDPERLAEALLPALPGPAAVTVRYPPRQEDERGWLVVRG